MTRTNEQLFASHVRRVHQRVAALEDRVLDKAPQLELEDRTLWMPQDQSRPDVLLDREEVELLAEDPVVALLRLLEPPQVRVEVVLGEPRGTVDALQHLAALVPARSEEHTSELQSQFHLVCRLLLEKKKKNKTKKRHTHVK